MLERKVTTIDCYLDDEGTLHVLVDNQEVIQKRSCGHLSEQGLHDIAYELLEEYLFIKSEQIVTFLLACASALC